ncbi:MAG: hypothetical protein IJT12_08250 [Paludibacteraceae bacterium]|nr:hypothetical protein [Paludibacteraceae bacterium]
MVRLFIDRIFRGAIRLVMLTGVAFTVTACYGLPPEQRYYDRYPEGPETQQPAEPSESDASDAAAMVDRLLANE